MPSRVVSIADHEKGHGYKRYVSELPATALDQVPETRPERTTHKRGWGWECIVDGCPNLAHKHDLCRRHWRLIPRDLALDIMVDCMAAVDRTVRAHEPEIWRLARAMGKGEQS